MPNPKHLYLISKNKLINQVLSLDELSTNTYSSAPLLGFTSPISEIPYAPVFDVVPSFTNGQITIPYPETNVGYRIKNIPNSIFQEKQFEKPLYLNVPYDLLKQGSNIIELEAQRLTSITNNSPIISISSNSIAPIYVLPLTVSLVGCSKIQVKPITIKSGESLKILIEHIPPELYGRYTFWNDDFTEPLSNPFYITEKQFRTETYPLFKNTQLRLQIENEINKWQLPTAILAKVVGPVLIQIPKPVISKGEQGVIHVVSPKLGFHYQLLKKGRLRKKSIGSAVKASEGDASLQLLTEKLKKSATFWVQELDSSGTPTQMIGGEVRIKVTYK